MKKYTKRLLGIVLTVALCLGMAPAMFAGYSPADAQNAAETLAKLGLFRGTSADTANPQFELDRTATRAEGLVVLVRLLGKEDAVLDQNGIWAGAPSPFTDVDGYAVPYAAYGYANGLVKGVGGNQYDPDAVITASQLLTAVLRALGYTDGTDFKWDSAWTLSDKIELTGGEFGKANNEIIRGEIAIILLKALYQPVGDSGKTLLKTLLDDPAVTGVTENAVKAAGLEDALTPTDSVTTPTTPIAVPGGSSGDGDYVSPVPTASFVGAYTVDGVNYALLSIPSGYSGPYTLDGVAVTASAALTQTGGGKLVKIAVPGQSGTVAARGGFSKQVTFGAVSAAVPETLYGTVPMSFSAFFYEATGGDVPEEPASTSFAAGGAVARPEQFISQGTRAGFLGGTDYESMPKVDAVSSATYGDSVHFAPTGNLTTDGSDVKEKTDPNAAVTGIKKVEVGISFDLYANARLLQSANRATAQSAGVLAAVADFELASQYYTGGATRDADGGDLSDLGVYKVKYLLTDGNWGARVAPKAGTAAAPAALPGTGTVSAPVPAVSYGGNWADKQITYTFGGTLEPQYAGNNYWDNFFEYAYGGYITDEDGHTEPLVFLQNLFSHRAHVNFDVAISPYRFARMKNLAASGTYTVRVLVYGFEDVEFTVELADYTNGNAAVEGGASIGLERGTAETTRVTVTGVEQYNALQAALKRGTTPVDAEKYALSYDSATETVTLALNEGFSQNAGFGGSYTLSFADNTDALRSKTIALTVTDLSFRPGLSSDGVGDGLAATQSQRLEVAANGRIYIHDNAYALALTLTSPRGAYSTITAEDDGLFSAINRSYDDEKGKYYIDLSEIQIDGESLHHEEDFTLTLVAPADSGGTLIYYIVTAGE